MRTTILVVLALLPALAACGSASAQTSGRAATPTPVCTHYDDNDKPAVRAASPASPVVAPAPSVVTPPAAASTPAVAAAAPALPAPASRGGGTDSVGHARNAPRWQTFLPGMFK